MIEHVRLNLSILLQKQHIIHKISYKTHNSCNLWLIFFKMMWTDYEF